MSGKRLSENGQMIAVCLLFPLLWPFLPLLLCFMIGGAIRNAYYARKFRGQRDEPRP